VRAIAVSLRAYIQPIGRKIYHKLPLPHSVKRRLVGLAFQIGGPLFKGDAQYELWRHAQTAWQGDLSSFELLPPATSTRDVFILSIINWDFRTQRPQHIARELARSRRVFFVEMDAHPSGFALRKVDENLFVVRFPLEGIGHIQPYSGRAEPGQVRAWLDALAQFCDRAGATSSKQVVVQHPFWWQMARHVPSDFEVVFDCMDDIGGFSNTTPFLISLEEDMLAKCDKLVVSSDYLFEKYKTYKMPALIRNAGEAEHFVVANQKRPLPRFLVAKGFAERSDKIRVGYVGAIAEWFDVELIAKAAEIAPDIEFHLCGSVTVAPPAKLALLPNVAMYGEVPYVDVPAFLERMDVLTIPFQLLPIIQACDPVKFYEYSAMGKPTVATRMPELKRASHLAFFASTPREYAEQIRVAAEKGKDSNFCAVLRAYAEENTWTHRGTAFESVLDGAART